MDVCSHAIVSTYCNFNFSFKDFSSLHADRAIRIPILEEIMPYSFGLTWTFFSPFALWSLSICSVCCGCPDNKFYSNSTCPQKDVLCYFWKLDSVIQLKLLCSNCSSFHGSSIWDLTCHEVAALYVSWRSALKRVWKFPMNAHSDILYNLCGEWPVEFELKYRILNLSINRLNSDKFIIKFVRLELSAKFSRQTSKLIHNNPTLRHTSRQRFTINFTSPLKSGVWIINSALAMTVLD
jgi:hypothetical protein